MRRCRKMMEFGGSISMFSRGKLDEGLSASYIWASTLLLAKNSYSSLSTLSVSPRRLPCFSC
jgi:hypothetical protein